LSRQRHAAQLPDNYDPEKGLQTIAVESSTAAFTSKSGFGIYKYSKQPIKLLASR
jgi:hypothetical protein